MLKIIKNCRGWLSRRFNIIAYLTAENLAAIRLGLDDLHDAVYVVVELGAPTHEFRLLFRRGHDPARVDSLAQDSDLREQELDSGAVVPPENS